MKSTQSVRLVLIGFTESFFLGVAVFKRVLIYEVSHTHLSFSDMETYSVDPTETFIWLNLKILSVTCVCMALWCHLCLFSKMLWLFFHKNILQIYVNAIMLENLII